VFPRKKTADAYFYAPEYGTRIRNTLDLKLATGGTPGGHRVQDTVARAWVNFAYPPSRCASSRFDAETQRTSAKAFFKAVAAAAAASSLPRAFNVLLKGSARAGPS
jgi:hypothetical protein